MGEIIIAPALLPEPPHHDAIDIRGAIELCLENESLLTAWEKKFVASIRYQHGLSEKQVDCLEGIARTAAARALRPAVPQQRNPRHRRKRRAA